MVFAEVLRQYGFNVWTTPSVQDLKVFNIVQHGHGRGTAPPRADDLEIFFSDCEQLASVDETRTMVSPLRSAAGVMRFFPQCRMRRQRVADFETIRQLPEEDRVFHGQQPHPNRHAAASVSR
jgi:hypothetical protein